MERVYSRMPDLEVLVPTPAPELLMPGEAAAIFRVDPKTVIRWAKAGRIRATRTPGGQWRIYASAVEAPSAPTP